MFGKQYIVTVIQAKLIVTRKVLHFENEGIFLNPENGQAVENCAMSQTYYYVGLQ